MMYWTGGDDSSGAVSRGWVLNGVFDPQTVYSGEHSPIGLTLDPERGRVYWTGRTAAGVGVVREGALNGSTAASTLYESADDGSLPLGIGVWRPWSLDARLFWAQQPAGGGDWSVWSGKPDGSEQRQWTQVPGGPANAIVPGTTGQQLFWTNGTAIELGDTNGPNLRHGIRSTSSEVRAVAVADVNRLYWVAAEGGDLTVYTGTVYGTEAEPLYEEADSEPLGGLVIAGNSIFWTVDNGAGAGTIMSGNVEGTRAPEVFEAALGPHFLTYLNPAVPLSRPTIGGGGKVGQELTCARGSWSEDRPMQSYFAAPNTFRYLWTHGGETVGEDWRLTPTEPGYYQCGVLAQNAAGGEWSASESFRVLPAPGCRDSSLATIAGSGVDASLPCSGAGSLTYSILSGPQHGKLTAFDQATGSYRYVPDGGFSGVDSFTYKAAESDAESQPATATIRVAPLPERPKAESPPPIPTPPSNRLRTLAPRLDRAHGTATLRLRVPGPGGLSLKGKRVRPAHVRARTAGVARLKVRPKPATRKQLVRRGRARVKVVVRFRPDDGTPRAVSRSVTLRLR